MASSAKWFASIQLAFVLASHPVHAEPTAADKETARSLLNEGDRKRDAKDLNAALDAYRAADAIMGVPTTGIEVAKTEERLGMLVEARDAALRITRLAGAVSEPRAYQQARAAAERLAADLAARIPSIQVKVRGARLEAITVELDGAAVAKLAADVPRKVNPGAHLVSARAPGYESARATVTLAERETRECELVLVPAQDGHAQVGPSPAAELAGSVAHNDPNDRPPDPRSHAFGPLVYVGGAIAVTGLAVGTVAGIAELARTSKAETTCAGGQRVACQSELDGAHHLATVANVSLGVGILGAALATFAILRASPTDAQGARAQTSLQLLVRPGAAGIAGTF